MVRGAPSSNEKRGWSGPLVGAPMFMFLWGREKYSSHLLIGLHSLCPLDPWSWTYIGPYELAGGVKGSSRVGKHVRLPKESGKAR